MDSYPDSASVTGDSAPANPSNGNDSPPVANANSNHSSLPPGAKRPPERRRREKGTRSLPADRSVLVELARTYVTEQIAHWPQLVKSNLLADLSDQAAIDGMVETFVERHKSGTIPMPSSGICQMFPKLSSAYSRFSCEHSSPTSISDQLVNELRRAKIDGQFIPWEWVLADYAISGLDNQRSDYLNLKKLIADHNAQCNIVYIDDFTRASRETLEWWKLANLIKRHAKNLIGASDGFDLRSPDAEVKISLFALFAMLFKKSLTERVKRGRDGAIRRHTSVGLPGFGHLLIPSTDANGQIVFGADGQPTMTYALDAERAAYLVEAAERVMNKLESFGTVARDFASRRVGGRSTWTDATLRNMLLSPRMLGIMIFDRTRQERDPETNKVTVHINPRRKWKVRRSKKLQILPTALWKALRRKWYRKPKSTSTTPKLSRNTVAPTTELSGLLFCACCGRELTLGRSQTKYKVFSCPSGFQQLHGCTMRGYKSRRMILTALLDHVRTRLMTPEFIKELVELSNTALADAVAHFNSREHEARRPELERRVREVKEKIARLTELWIKASGRPAAEPILAMLDDLKAEETQILKELLKLNDRKRSLSVEPIRLEDVQKHLANLESLFETALNEDSGEVGVAAKVLRSLVGQVTVHQSKQTHRRGYAWTLSFKPQVSALLPGKAFKGMDVPVQQVLVDVPKAVRLAPRVKDLLDAAASNGVTQSAEAIARALGVSYTVVVDAMKFLRTGVVTYRKRNPKQKPKTAQPEVAPYISFGPEVARLIDVERLSRPEAARQLKLNVATVRRAYAYAHKDDVATLVSKGQRIRHNPTPKVKPADEIKMRELKQQGCTLKQIAAATGLGRSTVIRVLQRSSAA